ncbi:MAG: PAS domain S-box protein [Nitrospirae bacterium]|nr:PAS domain S-box protein [Nitrospirota bacterium]
MRCPPPNTSATGLRRFVLSSDGALNDRGAASPVQLLRLSVVFALLFAALWGIHTAVLLQAATRYGLEEVNRRLIMMTQAIEADLRSHSAAALSDPKILLASARRYGAHRISILDRDGRLAVDTLTRAGDPLRGITPSQFRRIWDGAAMMTALFSDRNGRGIRSYFTPLRDSDDNVIGVLRVDLELKPLEGGGAAAATALLLRVSGAAMIVVLGFYAVRTVAQRRRTAGAEGGAGETAAVIATFHGLVRQLKDKELELEHLRALAEERADEIESYNENILQSVTSGVITFNPDHGITTFNHAAERILGLSRSDAVGKTCEAVFGTQSSIVHLLDQALSRQATITRRELELTRPLQGRPVPASSRPGSEPQRIWVGVSTSLLRDRQNALIGTTFVFTDLTEIKSLQEQVELKRRLTALGEMSAGIAHEFRNYMGSVMGFAKLLSKKLPASDTGLEMIASIMRELTAMNQLIEQLLSFGRHAELHLQPVALEPLIRRLLEHVIGQTEGVKPDVDVSIPPDLPEIRMDEVLMRQAIGNLFQNALDAMPQGGELQVRAGILDRDTSVGSESGGHRKELFLAIRDTGIGIPKEKLDKIFLPFFTTKEKGTGMGLALVHKIVLSHGGRIEVSSEEGRGTTFRIVLPV